MSTTLTAAQECIVVALRTTLLLPLDDLLAVTREFINPDVSRSGFLHVDIKLLPQMPEETARRYLFVAIDQPTTITSPSAP